MRHEARAASTIPPERWSAPAGCVKINVDGAFKEEDHTGGRGYIIRNPEELAEAAGAGRLSHIMDALQAESLALIGAIERASDLGCQNVIFETDSRVLQQAICTEEYDASLCGALFMKAKKLLWLYFNDAKIVWVPRVYNYVTHVLASHGAGLESGDQVHWLCDVPDFVNSAVASDLAGLPE